MQFRLFKRVFTFLINTKNPDFGISFRITKLEEPVVGFTSIISGSGENIYNGQKHFGMFDADNILPLDELIRKIKEVQEVFKDFAGDCYIYETSPKKYSFHFYNPASYWDWLKIVHYCRDAIDESYISWRLKRDNMVMRFTPKSNGFTPKLIRTIRTKHPKYEEKEIKNIVQNILLKEKETSKKW